MLSQASYFQRKQRIVMGNQNSENFKKAILNLQERLLDKWIVRQLKLKKARQKFTLVSWRSSPIMSFDNFSDLSHESKVDFRYSYRLIGKKFFIQAIFWLILLLLILNCYYWYYIMVCVLDYNATFWRFSNPLCSSFANNIIINFYCHSLNVAFMHTEIIIK